jgi:KGK domain
MQQERFQAIADEDMVSITHDVQILCKLKNFQTQELYELCRSTLQLTDKNRKNYHWFDQGIEACILPASKSKAGWIEGTVRLCLAFQPDELEADRGNSIGYIPDGDDVLEIIDETARFVSHQNVLINQLTLHIRQKFGITDPAQSRYYWLDRGIECKVLKTSGEVSGWQAGLIRLQFEFIPTSKNSIAENAAVIQPGLDSLRQLAVN